MAKKFFKKVIKFFLIGTIFYVAFLLYKKKHESKNNIDLMYKSLTSIKLSRPSKLKSNQLEHFDIILKPKYEKEMLKQAILVNTPGSKEFKKFLNTKMFRNRYGQNKDIINKWKNYLKRYHLNVMAYKNGIVLDVYGKVKNINRLFNVNINKAEYHSDPLQFGKKKSKFPTEISSTVLGVIGITDHNYKNFSSNTPYVTKNSNIENSFSKDKNTKFIKHYNINKLYKKGIKGAGQTIGIVAFGNVQKSNIIHFWKKQNVNSNPNRLHIEHINGPKYNNNLLNQDDTETTMDVEYAGLISPNSNIKIFLGPNNTPMLANFINIYSSIFDENKASSISSSWSLGTYMEFLKKHKVLCPKYGQILNIILSQGSLEGISNFISSGDSGAFNPTITGINNHNGIQDFNLTSEDPLVTNPYITSVGGTTLPFKKDLSRNLGINIGITTVKSERAWGVDYIWKNLSKYNNLIAKYPQIMNLRSGSGGGFSSLYKTPCYQQNVPGINTFKCRNYFSSLHQPIFNSALFNGNNKGRNYPDVSGNADPITGYYVYQKKDKSCGWFKTGGTSITAPQYAAVASLINSQDRRKRMGFWNPQIYVLAKSKNSPFTPLNSTIDNSNLYYTGQPGKLYNQATGLGTTDFNKLKEEYK